MDLSKLSDELNAFLDGYGLPHESADEVLCGLYDDLPHERTELTLLKIAYLENFIKRWDFAVLGEGNGVGRLEAFGCYVWLEDGTLFSSEIGDFERHGKDFDYSGEITAPAGNDFLDAVNHVLGTDFRFDQFAGR